MSKTILFILLAAVFGGLAADTPDFTITEQLGRSWENEVVIYTPTAAQLGHAKAGHLLAADSGPYATYQLLPDNQLAILITSLGPWQERTYTFTDEVAVTTDISLSAAPDGDAPGTLLLANSHLALRIRTSLAPGQGPIAAIRMGNDNAHGWVGGSSMDLPDELRATYRATVSYSGDLLARITTTIGPVDAPLWTTTYTLQVDQPVVTIEEDFRGHETANFSLNLTQDYAPTHLLYRNGKTGDGQKVCRLTINSLAEIKSNPVYTLEAWLHWWENLRQGNWFGLYREDNPRLLMVGAYRPSVWVNPELPRELRQNARVRLNRTGKQLSLDFVGDRVQRAWMIGVVDRDPSLGPYLTDPNVEGDKWAYFRATLPQHYLIKHGHFPLNAINKLTLTWPEPEDAYHPRLLISKEEHDALKETYAPKAPNEVERMLKQPIRSFQYDDWFYHALGDYNPTINNRILEHAEKSTEAAVNRLIDQNDLVYYGFAPHHVRELKTAPLVADIAFANPDLDPVTRQRMRAQLAFLGYLVTSPDYWSPKHGYSANPNMTTMVASYQSLIGALLQGHPAADAWLNSGLAELKRQLTHWSGPEGGWLEAPHYAMIALDDFHAIFRMANLANGDQTLYDPRMKRFASWFAQISTPPDARVLGYRHHPPIGNTYKHEPSGEYGIAAYLWKDKDPAFSAEMRWMYEQQGSFGTPGVGGFFASLAGYRRIFTSLPLPAKAPAYTSKLYPGATAILRHHFPTERETKALLIAGPLHDHYDDDSGSVTLWGKGRIIADDYGYVGRQPGTEHNMLISPSAPSRSQMTVDTFTTSGAADYLLATKSNWTREITLVKDADPLGPNFFIIQDTLTKPAAADWRLHLTAKSVTVKGNQATISGHEDIDTQLTLINLPAGASLTTKETSHKTWGLNEVGKYGRTTSTQTTLTASWEAGSGLTAIVYPHQAGEATPTITKLPDGQGIKIVTPAKTYVYLSQADADKPIMVDGKAINAKTVLITHENDQNPVVQVLNPTP